MNAPRLAELLRPGRSCPVDYTYAPAALAREPDFSAETLYVAGGLYGNLAALAAIEKLAAAEPAAPQVVFNGDFHWFDCEPDWFSAIEQGIAPYRALRGNVESEIARDSDIGAGCGCAYPDTVDEEFVRRSNDILVRLAAATSVVSRARLRALPMYQVARVGTLRVGIVHGDATSLAGWRFASEALDSENRKGWLNDVRASSAIDLFACTHTCLAALRDFALPAGRLTVINNGAAGMPNFSGTRFGIVSRIATTPSPHPARYGLRRDGIHIDAIAVDYDTDAFLDRFLPCWPEGSPAHASYYRRIVDGPDYALSQAAAR